MPTSTNERTNYVPGFEPVLLRSEIKKALKKYRFNQMVAPRDMHIERHLVTAAVQLVLSNDKAQAAWLDLVKESIKADIDHSMGLVAQQ